MQFCLLPAHEEVAVSQILCWQRKWSYGLSFTVPFRSHGYENTSKGLPKEFLRLKCLSIQSYLWISWKAIFFFSPETRHSTHCSNRSGRLLSTRSRSLILIFSVWPPLAINWTSKSRHLWPFDMILRQVRERLRKSKTNFLGTRKKEFRKIQEERETVDRDNSALQQQTFCWKAFLNLFWTTQAGKHYHTEARTLLRGAWLKVKMILNSSEPVCILR